MALYIAPNEDVMPNPRHPKIRQVRAYVSRSEEYGASDVHDTSDTHWILGLTDADGGWDHVTTHPPLPIPCRAILNILDRAPLGGSRACPR